MDNGEFDLFSSTDPTIPESGPPQARLLPILLKAVEDASEAIVVTEARLDPPGPRMLWVNPAFAEITGYDREEVVGKTPRILQGPETEPRVLQRLRDRLAAGERFEGEATNYRKDGTTYVNHWSIAPVYDKDGSIAYWVSIQRDVTEKRRLEREVLRAQQQERRRIGRDLHDSVGSDLISAGMLLENILERDVQDEDLAGRLRSVRAAIGRGYEDLRELTHGLSPVDLSEGSLMVALDNLVTRCSELRLESQGIDLDAVLSDWDIEDLAHLYWIVKEAVSNALKYAETDTIVIRASRVTEGYALSVEDDGLGFTPDAEGMMGWGLRTMRYRADLLQATLDIASQPGEGTRVTCRFPV
jgi:PAS domain S-box-containing protein